MNPASQKTAVVLFNLGGPDRPESVAPFLFNLFHDPAIIRLPQPFRWLVARFISGRRAPVAAKIYAELGGSSPLLTNTESQAKRLDELLGASYKTFVAMRYWHPRARAQVKAVKEWGADRVVLLPLYPQYSTTTTRSSVLEWEAEARRIALNIPAQTICCWPEEQGYVRSMAASIGAAIEALPDKRRVIFSAHGLPKRVVEGGDPYQWQVEQSARAIADALAVPDLDWVVSYQSRVGPLEWIGPSTEDEIRRAGSDGIGLIIVPVAFVSEHSETLVELDKEYAHLAAECGVVSYQRVPTASVAEPFIEGLARLVRTTIETAPARTRSCLSGTGGRICPPSFGECPMRG